VEAVGRREEEQEECNDGHWRREEERWALGQVPLRLCFHNTRLHNVEPTLKGAQRAVALKPHELEGRPWT
jgi:hypothetical protein